MGEVLLHKVVGIFVCENDMRVVGVLRRPRLGLFGILFDAVGAASLPDGTGKVTKPRQGS